MAIDRRRVNGGYVPLRDALDQLFQESVITPQVWSGPRGFNFPPVDMHSNEDDVIVKMAVPGANPDDINISVTGDAITISGEIKKQERGEKSQAHYEEIWTGNFQRAFTLPTEVEADKAEANFENGVLVVRIPKAETTKPRKIQIKQQQTISG